MDPWANIETPTLAHSLNSRRVDPVFAWNFFWARDVERRVLLVLRYTQGTIPDLHLPKLRGVEILLSSDEHANSSTLIIRLLDSSQSQLFFTFCKDIVSSTTAATSEQEAVELAIRRTWRWHHLLRSGTSKLLTEEEQKGLIGELQILDNHLLDRLSAVDAVTGWRGPFDAPKDYEFGPVCIEVKARRGTATPYVAISSEIQLDDSGLEALYLYVADLARATSVDQNSFSLTTCAETTRAHLVSQDPGAVELFERALSATGFRWEDDYSEFQWLESGSRFYEVGEGFPRIVAGHCGPGVSNVRYSISMMECQQFQVEPSVLDRLLEAESRSDQY